MIDCCRFSPPFDDYNDALLMMLMFRFRLRFYMLLRASAAMPRAAALMPYAAMPMPDDAALRYAPPHDAAFRRATRLLIKMIVDAERHAADAMMMPAPPPRYLSYFTMIFSPDTPP